MRNAEVITGDILTICLFKFKYFVIRGSFAHKSIYYLLNGIADLFGPITYFLLLKKL